MKVILRHIININRIKGLDAFFDYSGHVNMFSLSIDKNAEYCEGGNRNPIYKKRVYLPLTKKIKIKILNELRVISHENK